MPSGNDRMTIQKLGAGFNYVDAFGAQRVRRFVGVDLSNNGLYTRHDRREIHLCVCDGDAQLVGIADGVRQVCGVEQGFAGNTTSPRAVAAESVGFDQGDPLAQTVGEPGRRQAG